jgi:hypothetical protein
VKVVVLVAYVDGETYCDIPVVVVPEHVVETPGDSKVKYPLPGLGDRHPHVMLNLELGEPEQLVEPSHQLTSIW